MYFIHQTLGKTWWKANSGLLMVYMVLSCVNQGYTECSEEPPSIPPRKQPQQSLPSNLCTSNECLRSAANLKLSMDMSVDPCDDFYEYSCGKWSDIHPDVKLDSTYDAYDTIDDRISVATKEILMDPKPDEPIAVAKTKAFYFSCLDMDTRNSLGLKAMHRILKKVKLPSIPHFLSDMKWDEQNFAFNWKKSEALIKRYLGLDIFFGAQVKVNPYNVSQNILVIGTMTERDYLPSPNYPEDDDDETSDDEKDNERSSGEDNDNSRYRNESYSNSENISRKWIVKANIIKYILSQAAMNKTGTIPEDSILQDAVDIIKEVGDTIEEIYTNYTFTDDENLPPLTLKELQSRSDDYLSSPLPNFWWKYFKYLFTGSRVKINPDKLLVHYNEGELEYLNLMLQYLSNTPDIYIELYMWWQTVEKMILSTSADVIFHVTQQTGDDYETYAGSEEKCIRLIEKYMGYAITYALAEELYPNTTKPKIGRMLRRLKTAFEDHVRELDWMDNATKEVTLEKSREMKSFIGYPDWLFNDGALDRYYSGLHIGIYSYLSNLINRISHYNLGILNTFNKTHKRSWHNDDFDEREPISANAFYSLKDNAMEIPMGILMFPMYDLGLEVLNYGSLGTTLGHELTHGFDNLGRQRDKYGNCRQWWGNSTIEEFTDLVECFEEQYSYITIEGVNGRVNGMNTLSENVADNGGLHQAFRAYKSFQESSPREPKLPGFENFTDDMMFFIAYASTWCKTTTTSAVEVSLKSSKYAPFSVRLLGTLQNSKDFSRVFNCSEGSFMNPVKKCRIW